MVAGALHFVRRKPHASPMDPALVITHLGAAIGGIIIIGVSLCRSRHLR